jgi:prepilin-type N-terminal cleavage/methylation domain-containing protein
LGDRVTGHGSRVTGKAIFNCSLLTAHCSRLKGRAITSSSRLTAHGSRLTGKAVLRCRKGFTLLELIIVIFLIALIVAISSAFSVGSFSSSSWLSAVARDLSSAVRQTRGLALVTGRSQTMIIDLDNQTYGIEGYRAKKFPKRVTVSVIAPSGGERASGIYSLLFPATGGIEGAATIVVRAGRGVTYIQPDPVIGAFRSGASGAGL